MPLVTEAFNWQHGTFLGATASSETTAAATGKVGQLRRDPMAMLPFCGYHMGDYFAHWLKIGEPPTPKAAQDLLRELVPPRRKGEFLWPGYGENSRVLKWIFERCEGTAHAVDTPLDAFHVPTISIPMAWTFPPLPCQHLLSVDIDGWLAEIPLIREYFGKFGTHMPEALNRELDDLDKRLRTSISGWKDEPIWQSKPARQGHGTLSRRE